MSASALLRQSSRSLARISRSSLRRSLPLRSSISASIPQTRSYSTPTPPKDDKKNDKKKESKETEDASSKPAPGTENLYNSNKPSALSPETSESSESQLEPGWTHMSPADLKDFQDLLNKYKDGLPQSEVKIIERSLELMKKRGIPIELREFLDETRGRTLTLSEAAKLLRLTGQMLRKTLSTDRARTEKSVNEADEGKESSSSSSGGNGGGNGGKKNPKSGLGRSPDFKFDTSSMLISAFVSYMLYLIMMPGESGRDITFQEFRSTFLDKGLVEKLTVVNLTRVRVDLHRESAQSMYPDSPAANPNFHYYFSIGSVEAFERSLDDAQKELGIPSSERIPVSYSSDTTSWAVIMSFGPTLLFIGALYWFSRRATSGSGGASGMFGMGKSRAKQ